MLCLLGGCKKQKIWFTDSKNKDAVKLMANGSFLVFLNVRVTGFHLLLTGAIIDHFSKHSCVPWMPATPPELPSSERVLVRGPSSLEHSAEYPTLIGTSAPSFPLKQHFLWTCDLGLAP